MALLTNAAESRIRGPLRLRSGQALDFARDDGGSGRIVQAEPSPADRRAVGLRVPVARPVKITGEVRRVPEFCAARRRRESGILRFAQNDKRRETRSILRRRLLQQRVYAGGAFEPGIKFEIQLGRVSERERLADFAADESARALEARDCGG